MTRLLPGVQTAPRALRVQPLAGTTLLALHLVPGALIAAAFVVFARLLAPFGTPANLALLLAMLFVALPVEVGTLAWLGKRQRGSLGVRGLIAHHDAFAPRETLVLVSLLFIWSVVVYTLLAPVAEAIRQALFSWWPSWLRLDDLALQTAANDRTALVLVAVFSLGLNILVPAVEELYFRGYLLPRMGRWGHRAPALNAALFSLYHFWLPWEFFSRLVALLPAIYVVWWKGDLRLSLLVHVLLNTVGSILLLVFAVAPR